MEVWKANTADSVRLGLCLALYQATPHWLHEVEILVIITFI